MIPPGTANKKGMLLQAAVQYNVSGTLEGTVPAPSVAAGGRFDEDNVYQIDVDDLGIIDPDLLGGVASRADRFITWLRVESPIPFGAGFRISRVNAQQLVPSLGIIELQRLTPASIVGSRQFTTTECFTIPQGQAIQITGGPAGGGLLYHVSMGIRYAASRDDEARLANMCCCQTEGAAGGGGGDEQAIASLDFLSFSNADLTVDPATDHYLIFSADMSGGVNISDSIQPSIDDPPIGTEKLSIRAGSVTAFVIRSSAAMTITVFVDVATGAGAFVRTVVAPATAIAANTNVNVPITAQAFPVDARIRVGFTVAAPDTVEVQVELEITTEVTP